MRRITDWESPSWSQTREYFRKCKNGISYEDAGSNKSNNDLSRSLYRNLEGRYTDTVLLTRSGVFSEKLIVTLYVKKPSDFQVRKSSWHFATTLPSYGEEFDLNPTSGSNFLHPKPEDALRRCNKTPTYYTNNNNNNGPHGSVVGWGTMLQDWRSQVQFPMRSLDFSIDLILPAALWPGVDSTFNRNEYQETSWGVKGVRRVRLTTSPPSVSRLSKENVGASTSHNPMGLHGMLEG
jgi:hypothetical protein